MDEKITEQERLRRQVKILSDIIRKVPGFVFWKDRNLILQGCNENFAHQVGFNDPNDIIGLTDEQLPWNTEQTEKFHRDDQEVLQKGISKLNIEEQQHQRNGQELTLLTSKVPLYERGQVTGVLGIYMDITPLKLAEQALREQKAKADAANQLKRDFIRNMQHDIRTPISGIWSLSELLLTEPLPPTTHRALSEIANAAKELLDYCNELVDFAHADYGDYPVVKKPFDLKALVHSVMDMQRPAAQVKSLVLSLHASATLPAVLLGDAYRIKRILINLLSNAIKFTPKGQVQLQVNWEQPNPDSRKAVLQFTLLDSGIGINADQIDRIYEKFARLSPSNQGRYKGSGLGLCQVKQFVEELDGDIQVCNQPQQGTTFTVFLPVCLPLSTQLQIGDHPS